MKAEENLSLTWGDEAYSLSVKTLRSTDCGVAFLIHTEGKDIYHAGDLNWWVWPGESKQYNNNMTANFKRYTEPLKGLDLFAAFLPLDPRQEEWYDKGFSYILENTKTRYAFPMHFWKDFSVIQKYLETPAGEKYRDHIVVLEKKDRLSPGRKIKEEINMKFQMIHENYNVRDLDRSLAFYEKALGLKEKRRTVAKDGSFIIVYVGNETTDFELELTWMRDFDRDYDLETVSSIWPSAPQILTRPTSFTKKWDVSVLKIRIWGFILSKIPMDIGWRSYRKDKSFLFRKQSTLFNND